ncbi:monofunctional biosynthetic peptidoglycan transglycosylase [Paracoccus sp. S-4012]|uniref:monofunctional biosynthetic peptidoglycan transglycosylase n=1 Tax=Paracoccus sp. S-4012 TaxID=2665648 RepID=UPI0012B0C8D2|nr:monofunctional biosynthetic peptidoglycan transglycosylase [Paracoccus sp. S-4012]MRX50917.1 monofunctional biosynthetic peptidoglycan transglycosylase [Paracoccus sp. S-4012]
MPPHAPAEAADAPSARRIGGLRRLLRRSTLRGVLAVLAVVALFAVLNPPTTLTILAEGTPGRRWTPIARIAPEMLRAVVAAEDANFCRHWGFDMAEIRKVIESGSDRGASTISQQTAKNVFLWQGRSWVRKGLEAGLTPVIEALWTKRRILEVYVNLAEFGPGIFGVAQAAEHHWGTTPDKLTAMQAARLAAVLPAPKTRDPKGQQVARRAAAIADGAATIGRDGRAACFEATTGG